MLCVRDCPSNSIDIEMGSIADTCIHCGHCVAICPEATISPDHDEIRKLQKSKLGPDEFVKLSSGLRTCRSYQDREVDDETLNLLVENMKHYPSASNARPVNITILKSREVIQKINDETALRLINAIKLYTAPVILPVLHRLAPKLDLPRLNNYKKQFMARQVPGASLVCHHAPAVMIFHAPVTRFGMAAADAYIWATYTSIYASTLGLGSCFNGFISSAMSRRKNMRKAFHIPDGHQVYAALLIGYPKVKYLNETGRKKPPVHYMK